MTLTYWTQEYPRSREHADHVRRALRGETATMTRTVDAAERTAAKPLDLDALKATMAELAMPYRPEWWVGRMPIRLDHEERNVSNGKQ